MASTLRFARLSFEAKLTTNFGSAKDEIERRRKLLLSVVNSKTDINDLLVKAKKEDLSEGFDWKFGGITCDGECIYGRLGKIKNRTQTIFDESLKDFKVESRKAAEVSTFLIDLAESAIVYESKKDVGRNAPIRLLSEVFNQYHNQKEQLTINQLTDKRELGERIKDLDKVVSFSLDVWPTNPNSTQLSKEFDKSLREGNLKVDIKGKAKSRKQGIHLDKISWLTGGFDLAGEGFGRQNQGRRES